MKRLLAFLLALSLLLSGCAAHTATTGTESQPNISTEDIGYMSVHYIDVGQADCILLIAEETTILIDAGRAETSLEVVKYLQQFCVDELDLVISTHPHGDHLGGIPTVMSQFPVKEIWSSTTSYDTYLFERFCYFAEEQDVEIEVPAPGTTYKDGGLTVTVLGPLGSNYEDLNDTSLVVMVQFGDRKFLFTGDMEALAEKELLNAKVDLKADVLKVGHHGSYSSTSLGFLNAVDPDYAVISCGRNNEYGHPHSAPMGRLERAKVELYRTDLMGDIVISTDGQYLKFYQEFEGVSSGYDQAA